MAVKHRPYLQTDEEDQEQVEAENPADLRVTVLAQLVRLKVRLEDGARVDEAEDGSHGAKRAKDNEPCFAASLGERPVRLGLRQSGTNGVLNTGHVISAQVVARAVVAVIVGCEGSEQNPTTWLFGAHSPPAAALRGWAARGWRVIIVASDIIVVSRGHVAVVVFVAGVLCLARLRKHRKAPPG